MKKITVAFLFFLAMGVYSTYAQSTEADEMDYSLSLGERVSIWWQKFNNGREAGKANVYGHRGYKFAPHRANRDIQRSMADFAPDRPTAAFNGTVIESIQKFSGNRDGQSRRQRIKQIQRRNRGLAHY